MASLGGWSCEGMMSRLKTVGVLGRGGHFRPRLDIWEDAL